MNAKKLKTIGLSLAVAFGATACGRITENEAAVIMNKGAIKETVTEAQLYCVPMCSPFTDIIRFKTFTDTFTLTSGGDGVNTDNGQNSAETMQSRQIFLRSKDDKFIESISLSISTEIVKVGTENTLPRLVTEFRADQSSTDQNALLIRDDLQILATQPLVNTIRAYDAMDIQDHGDKIGETLVAELQAAIDKRLEIKEGEVSPIKVKTVILGGVKFDPETEALLKAKIFAKEQKSIAEEAGKAAEIQATAAAKQADVTAQIAGKFKEAGLPDSQIGTLTCLDLQRQKQIPDSVQCFGIGGFGKR